MNKRSRDPNDTPSKKPKKPKKPSIPLIKVSTLLPRLLQWKEKAVGIDLSLANPSIAMVDPPLRQISLYYYRNRKSDLEGAVQTVATGPFTGWTVRTKCWERDPELLGTSSDRFGRYHPVIRKLVETVLEEHVQVIGVEHYSLGTNHFQSSSQSLMIELGACLRYELFQKVRVLTEIPPTQVKRMFTGVGKATKDDMYKAYREIYELPCLQKMLGFTRELKHLQKPVDDCVDALAVAFCTIMLADVPGDGPKVE